MAEAAVFRPRVVGGLVGAGLASFIALLLLLAYGGSIGSRRGGPADAASIASTGFKGLVQLVDRVGDARLVDDDAGLASEDLLIVPITERTRREDLERIFARHRGPTLLILPKWITLPDPQRRGWVRVVEPVLGQAAAALLGGDVSVELDESEGLPVAVRGDDFLSSLTLPVPARPQVITGKDVTPLVNLPGGGALVAKLSTSGGGSFYVLADPDVLNNQALRTEQGARFALGLIEGLNSTGATGVGFLGSVVASGASGRSLLRLALEPPFLAMTLALLAAALIAGLHGAVRFGPVARERRAIAFGKAVLVENSAGLIRLARREARLGPAYADLIRHESARAANFPTTLSEAAIDHRLERLGRQGEAGFVELSDRLRNAGDRNAFLAAARTLFQWKKDTIA